MADFTANYGLHQWVPEDDFLRTDFNEDFEKIDTALGEIQTQLDTTQTAVSAAQAAAAAAQITADGRSTVTAGIYTGDGATSQTIQLGFTPRAVLVFRNTGATYSVINITYVYGGLTVPNSPILYGNSPCLEVTENGFIVYQDGSRIYANISNGIYNYIALE